MTLRRSNKAFTLVEMLVSITVLTLIVLLISRLFNSASALITSGNKRMDVDGQARPLLDRMAMDFAQMVKRSDVDYYVKSSSNAQAGNDQIAFYSVVLVTARHRSVLFRSSLIESTHRTKPSEWERG